MHMDIYIFREYIILAAQGALCAPVALTCGEGHFIGVTFNSFAVPKLELKVLVRSEML